MLDWPMMFVAKFGTLGSLKMCLPRAPGNFQVFRGSIVVAPGLMVTGVQGDAFPRRPSESGAYCDVVVVAWLVDALHSSGCAQNNRSVSKSCASVTGSALANNGSEQVPRMRLERSTAS